MRAMIIEKFDKKFHKLYYLMKAYWYGFDEYVYIKDYDIWSNDMLDDMLDKYSGAMLIKGFIKYVDEQLDIYIETYKKLIIA